MEAIFKNDIEEGNKTLMRMSKILQMPYKSRIMSQIIFQQAYPRFFRKESHNLIAFISTYIALKINETIVKLDVLLDTMPPEFGAKNIPRNKIIRLECKIIEICNFNFDIQPAQIFLLKIGKSLGIDVSNKLKMLDDVHEDNRVNSINYFNGIYDPESIAISVLDNNEISLFESIFCVELDKDLINEIREVILNINITS